MKTTTLLPTVSSQGPSSVLTKVLWALSLLLILAVNGLVCLWIVNTQRPVVVVFDMKQTVDTFFDSAMKQKLTEEQSKALSDRFTRSLDESLKSYQQSRNALILVAPAVVSGAKDVTREIQHDVAKRMKQE